METTVANAKENSKRGPIVEDETVSGGLDANGRPIVESKTPDGKAPDNVHPTDPREESRK